MKSRACSRGRCGGCAGTVYVPVELRRYDEPKTGSFREPCECDCAHDRVVTNLKP